MKLEDLDHPIVFVIAMLMVITALQYVAGWGFTALGWSGPANLTKGYGA